MPPCVGQLRCGTTCCAAAQISGGEAFTCAVSSAGGVSCAGSNAFRQVGQPSNYGAAQVWVVVSPLTMNLSSVACGGTHALARTTAGRLAAWGSNLWGELGVGSTGGSTEVPLVVTGYGAAMQSAKQVAAGSMFSCLVSSANTVRCWGDGTGQVLDPVSNADRNTPGDLWAFDGGVSEIALGKIHGCAVVSGGQVQCWGNAGYGQLGGASLYTFATVPQVSNAVHVEVGLDHSCAIDAQGAMTCWGRSDFAQASPGVKVSQVSPQVVTLPAPVATAALGDNHTCALLTTGAVYCWGRNDSGQLGDGTTSDRLTPAQVTGLASGVTAIGSGWNHVCVVQQGQLKCWGRNDHGQLGDNSQAIKLVPTPVVAL